MNYHQPRDGLNTSMLNRIKGWLRNAVHAVNIPALHREIAELKRQQRAHRCTDQFRGKPSAVMITSDTRFGPERKMIFCRIEYGEAQWPTEKGIKPIGGWILSPNQYQDTTELARMMGWNTDMDQEEGDAG